MRASGEVSIGWACGEGHEYKGETNMKTQKREKTKITERKEKKSKVGVRNRDGKGGVWLQEFNV